jgi:hypothetical protein
MASEYTDNAKELHVLSDLLENWLDPAPMQLNQNARPCLGVICILGAPVASIDWSDRIGLEHVDAQD